MSNGNLSISSQFSGRDSTSLAGATLTPDTKTLLDSISQVEKFTEERKKSVVDALKFFNMKSDTVRIFGRKLQDFTDGIPKFGVRGELEGGCIQRGIEVVRAMEEHLGMMYTMMEVEMKEKVIIPIEAEKERTNNITKNALNEMYRFEKEQRENLAKISKSQQKYYKCREDNVDLEKQLETEDYSNGDEEDLRAQMAMKQREIVESRELYIASVKNARTAKLYGDRRIGKLIDAMQTLEKERINSLINSIKNYVEVQVKTYRLLLEEVEAASRTFVDEVKFNSEEELRKSSAFLHGTLTGQALPTFQEWVRVEKQFGISNLFSFLKPKTKHSSDSTPDEDSKTNQTLSLDVEDAATGEQRFKWISWFDHQFECLGNSQSCKCTSPRSNDEMFSSLLTRQGRKVFAQTLATYRNKNSGMVKNKEALENIVSAMIMILDSVDKEVASQSSPKAPRSTARDVGPVKEVMIVSQTLYFGEIRTRSPQDVQEVSADNSSAVSRLSSESMGQKDFLAKFIKHHPLWRDDRLWDEMFFASIQFEKHQKRMVEIEPWLSDEEATSLRQHNNNVLFGQLVNISHSMTLFGNSIETAKNFVEKTARLHDLPDEFKLQILFNIEMLAQDSSPSPEEKSRLKALDSRDSSTLPPPLPANIGPPPGVRPLIPPTNEDASMIASSSPGEMIQFLTSPAMQSSPHPAIHQIEPRESLDDLDDEKSSRASSPEAEPPARDSSPASVLKFAKAPLFGGKPKSSAVKPPKPSSPTPVQEERGHKKKNHLRRSSSNRGGLKPVKHSRSSSSNAQQALRESAGVLPAKAEADVGVSPHDKKTRVPNDDKRRV